MSLSSVVVCFLLCICAYTFACLFVCPPTLSCLSDQYISSVFSSPDEPLTHNMT